ncbi:RdgB/HAM1 family non-canonical purine NTP pyrophosphatase [Thermoflexus sp.]|uniref:RdgB/HAM1 family non-canonical purine NTP pyrophosphatase n=2 Tax=Thermoflexus sp. TaxID=1969742 RepID=UPI0025FA960F|nr:RdgB/HAM1 family non-canonical purine NTP pyrophosphatase [Thermoflexus sp.]MCS6963147.1 RdgB/HAM1 family non-canonical purine NTP pyrophosphatase [Thermoflexus sp.]MCX7689550.1 RdgB/HAM1 family non-canonical purine NTP pyrophosphatase [Thermoflexus sp.]MDW8185840.1 RdgB/HAM1 family non-canonical purine NTP pyrophosphatase [Anaerolineae bacterium]
MSVRMHPPVPPKHERRLLIATHNPGKRRELAALLSDLPLRLIDLLDLGISEAAEEPHESLEDNARWKAMFYAERSGLWTLADDSGLEIDALGGAPGVRSARFAGPDADDRMRIRKVLELMASVPWPQRTARFRCVIALARPGEPPTLVEGRLEGYVAFEPRGTYGFGYDPIFYIPELGKTMAELPLAMKNQISHRARAAWKAREILRQWLAEGPGE